MLSLHGCTQSLDIETVANDALAEYSALFTDQFWMIMQASVIRAATCLGSPVWMGLGPG